MANHDGRRSRPGQEGRQADEKASWGTDPVGKQSLIEQEFGVLSGPGLVVQRRRSSNPGAGGDLWPGRKSLVEAEFGCPVPAGPLVQQRAATTPTIAAPISSPDAGLMQRIFDLHDLASVQRRAAAPQPADDTASVHAAAAKGVTTPASTLPHSDTIQRAFGHHDVSAVQAHTGSEAGASARAMGADAYATGNHIVLGGRSDLHTVAHEAAHVVQQRGGVQLKGGVGAVGDAYEQHADAVADRVVAGESAASLLDQMSGGGHSGRAVQRAPAIPATPATGASDSDPEVTPPIGGIDKPGFIDNSDGANIRTGPAEAGGKLVRSLPLPPATRVFVSGAHPSAPEWWYVTAYLDNAMVRGYVQYGRVNTDLPEPTAKLHQVVSGDTAEKLAVQEYKGAVRDGHDLRYYENVLLYLNKQQNRDGITGSYQDPGVLGRGNNNVQLVAGHRIWLVSPAYAKALEGVVPDGSLTGGAVAKVKRFAGHLQDILHSVTESRNHLREVAGQYADAIREHESAIIGIVAGFITAEAASALLAATPTGVTQIVAVVIQLALSAFGAAGMIQAGADAMTHGSEWLTTAWTANGDPKQVAAASTAFLKMLVSLAMAALSYLGAKANYGNALKIANSMPTGGLPALAMAGGGQMTGAGGTAAHTSVMIGPGAGSLGVGGAMMSKVEGEGDRGGGHHDTATVEKAKPTGDAKPTEAQPELEAEPEATKRDGPHAKEPSVMPGRPTVGLAGRLLSPEEAAAFDGFAARAKACGWIENPFRTGSWGTNTSGKFRELARIDVAEAGKPGWRGRTHIHITGQPGHLNPSTLLPGE